MKSLLPFLLFIVVSKSLAQVSDEETLLLSRLKESASLPEKILNTRTAVFFTYTMRDKELEDIQKNFQRTGIDAVAYFETDKLIAGKDVTIAFARYLIKRDITNLAFFQKTNTGYKAFLTQYNAKASIIEQNQFGWIAEDVSLAELMRKIYRAAGGGMKRQNMLINDVPEKDMSIEPIEGRRSEFFAIDLKVDNLAVPKTGNETMDKVLEQTFGTYPLKYKLTDPGISEQDLRKKGFLYVLCYVRTRGSTAKELLSYDNSKPEKMLVSITYPDGAPSQLKNIPPETFVYKFYFKHIDSGNVFLGTKWDADVTWEQALKNHIRAFKNEFKLE